ncbi:hypothetical protein QVD17_02843 [Tagetes erecta]|uniref:AP2/ERF domain-containing protein n=1 Tax=Tagetes erecta TaxID=13708 RepID=A0AAD8P845_TARER|nr:hypothetical protein QVD17_02843 [Tagetes erecta]
MLDLNMNFVNEDETPAFEEESCTSNSSVVNADSFITTNASSGFCYNFDILKVDETASKRFMSRSLFPLSQLEDSSRLLCPNSNELDEKRIEQVSQQKRSNVQPKKSRRGPRSKSSQYRGVTFYRRTGRWESHIWDCGKQVYLGGFDTAHAAARAYDRAAIKFRGVDADINFNVGDYEEDLKTTVNFSKEEFVHKLRRQSTGFSRGSSKYRGVTLHKCGRWEARMGQFLGKKYTYLGLFDSEADAARAYDKAAVECNGREMMTNFEASTYKGNILPAMHHGDDHDLSLSLGISTTLSLGAGSSRNDNLKLAFVDHVSAINTSRDPSSWSHVYPPFVPNHMVDGGYNYKQIPVAASSGFLASTNISDGHHLRDTISLPPLNRHYSQLTAAASPSQD